jgi:2,4-dienoyl-CoA reductase-like NADH-dependent reductase (Old Yellow Enzyme family)/thioredoxin reductase
LTEKKPGEIRYPNLFSPITIRGKVYKNRLIAAPTMFVHASYFIPEIKENIYRMVEGRAKGGFACVSTGEMPLNFDEGRTLFQERAIDMTHFYGSDFDVCKEYADRIKAGGALAYFEFSHEGSRAEESPAPWGPCDVVREDGQKVYAMDRQMMEKVCKDFYTASRFAKECGFDGVLLHGGHGFLLQQYVSPWTNHRSDEFGGSIENRSRFPKMVIEACRAGIGDDGVIELRFSAEDGVPGGMTIDDTVGFCKQIDGMVDIIQVSNGLKWLGNQTKTFSDLFKPHGLNVEYAAKVKAAVSKSYVATIGGFNGPELAEKVIAEGKADFVEFARQCFADPDLPNKTLEGHEDEIRRCVRCFHCYPGFCEHPTDIPLWDQIGPEAAGEVYSPAAMGSCSINPKTGFGFYPDRLPVPEGRRKVLVIGGGVGGMQAAITACERGHDVTLVEAGPRLGGELLFTEHDEDKVDLHAAMEVIVADLGRSGAKVMLDTVADEDLIKGMAPDAVIVAVGAHNRIPDMPGIDGVLNASDVYYHMDEIGHTVAIAGGGLTACEVGLHLARHGHEVTMVVRKPRIARETFGYYRNALLDEMDKRGIVQDLSTTPIGFVSGGILCDRDGERVTVKADTCLYSFGMEPNSKEAATLVAAAERCGAKTWNVGNSSRAGMVADAVHGGYQAAMAII